MKTNWEPLGTRARLWYHHAISAAMRARYLGPAKPVTTYGGALARYYKGMLGALARPMEGFTVVSVRRLDPQDPEHGTWNLVLEGRGRPDYAPGDMAYLSWRNPDNVVQQVLDLYGESGDRLVMTRAHSSIYIPGRYEVMTLRQALSRRVDLHQCSERLVGRLGFGEFVAHNKTQDRAHRQFHKDEAKNGGLLVDHPHFDYWHVHLPSVLPTLKPRPSLAQLVRLQDRIGARPYTMSGFEQVAPDRFRFEITVSQVDKEMFTGRDQKATVAARSSSYLSSLGPGDEVEGWLLPEVHHFPPTLGRTEPLIVVATGSGVGGLLALLKTRPVSTPLWLIYGVRSWTKKHLYGPELQAFVDGGQLTRLDAVNSRPLAGEGPARRVQAFLWDHRAEVADQIRRGAHFYLCGRLSMGVEVTKTLEAILVDQGLAPDQAAARKTLIDWTANLRFQASVSGV